MMGLVMLVMLASSVHVHAEKWTLWAHETDRSGTEEWRKVREAATEAECWASFDTLRSPAVDVDVVRTVLDDHKITAYYRDGTKYVFEFTCFPATIDPRGPKGK